MGYNYYFDRQKLTEYKKNHTEHKYSVSSKVWRKIAMQISYKGNEWQAIFDNFRE